MPLPLAGPVGIGPRLGGASPNQHQMIVNFVSPITIGAGGTVSVTSGTGTVSSYALSGSQATINLSGVTNAQRIAVTLSNVNDGTNTGNVAVPMGLLLGDVNSSRFVDSADIGLVQRQNSKPLSLSNFRMDVNSSGFIDSADVGVTQRQNGQSF